MIYIFSRPFFRGEKGESYFYKTCGVSRRHRHLERRGIMLWETDRNRSHDTLSREISCLNASCTMEE